MISGVKGGLAVDCCMHSACHDISLKRKQDVSAKYPCRQPWEDTVHASNALCDQSCRLHKLHKLVIHCTDSNQKSDGNTCSWIVDFRSVEEPWRSAIN